MAFDTRLIPNYIAALAILGVFLWAVGYTLVNIDSILTIAGSDPKQNFIMGSIVTGLFTLLGLTVKEVTTYLFRKNPSTDTGADVPPVTTSG